MLLEPGYELFDVTADVGVVARGPTREEAFAQAARGMYATMVDLASVGEREPREIRVHARDLGHLLELWLLELLYLTESEGLLFSRFEVAIDERLELRAVAWGEPMDADRHELGAAVKAVTRHQLRVREIDGGWEARVIFDI